MRMGLEPDVPMSGLPHPYTRVPCLAAVALIVLLSSPLVSAQDDTRFDRFELGPADGVYVGTVISLDVGLHLVEPRGLPGQEPPRFDLNVHDALVWENAGLAATFSDVLLISLVTSALVLPSLEDWSFSRQRANATMVALEALSTVDLVTYAFKHLTRRQRPREYYDDHDGGYDSFFSGHTSISFAAATLLTVYAYEFEWLSDEWRWVIPTTSYLGAGAVAYFRVAGDRHWLSDVLIGSAVGTGLSYLVYLLRAEFD